MKNKTLCLRNMKKSLLSLLLGTALVLGGPSAFAITPLLSGLLRNLTLLDVEKGGGFPPTYFINLKNGSKIALTEQAVSFGSLQIGTKITIELVPTRINPMILKNSADRYIDKIEEFKKANPSIDFEFGEDKAMPIRPLGLNADKINAGVFERFVNELVEAAGNTSACQTLFNEIK